MPEVEPQHPSHYKYRILRTERPDGGIKLRGIYAPDDEAREAGIEMLQSLYDAHLFHGRSLRPETFVDAGMPGTTVMDNVLPHRDNKLFYLLDLKNAFPSVSLAQLRGKLQRASPSLYGRIDEFLVDYGTTHLSPGLPQGAPTSPYFFNFYLKDMDEDLDHFCAVQGLTYTRWLDDITISYPFEQGGLGEKARRTIREIIQETRGMQISPQKTRLHRLSNGPVTITGVSLQPNGRIQAAPHIIQHASDVFSDTFEAILAEEYMTPHHQAVINGHHGALVSMSEEPFKGAVARQIERYHAVAHLLHNTLAIQDEPSLEAIKEHRRATLFALARNLEQEVALIASDKLLSKLEEYRSAYDDLDPEVHVLMAMIFAPIFEEALNEKDIPEVPERLRTIASVGQVAVADITLFDFPEQPPSSAQFPLII